jgi:hypothetical protein
MKSRSAPHVIARSEATWRSSASASEPSKKQLRQRLLLPLLFAARLPARGWIATALRASQ